MSMLDKKVYKPVLINQQDMASFNDCGTSFKCGAFRAHILHLAFHRSRNLDVKPSFLAQSSQVGCQSYLKICLHQIPAVDSSRLDQALDSHQLASRYPRSCSTLLLAKSGRGRSLIASSKYLHCHPIFGSMARRSHHPSLSLLVG